MTNHRIGAYGGALCGRAPYRATAYRWRRVDCPDCHDRRTNRTTTDQMHKSTKVPKLEMPRFNSLDEIEWTFPSYLVSLVASMFIGAVGAFVGLIGLLLIAACLT